MERHTKLVLALHLGKRNGEVYRTLHCASWPTPHRPGRYQLTTDGFRPYMRAVKNHLSGRVHFAQLVKVYAAPREGEQRYSPAEVVDAVPSAVMGIPQSATVFARVTSNGRIFQIRMGMRRMTRLTNAFSKKWENLKRPMLSGLRSTTFAGFTRRCASLLRWKRGIASHPWTVAELLVA